MLLRVIFSLLFASLLISSAYADTVHLRNGDTISGTLLSFQNGICVFKTKYDAAIKINVSDIHSISTDTTYLVTLNNGEVVKGRIETKDEKSIIVSKSLGNVDLDFQAISRIIRASDVELVTDMEKSIGKDADKTPPLEFLTGSTVLLAPGQYQFEMGLDYRQNRDFYPIPNDGYFQNHSYSARMLRFDSTLRAGISEGIETFISIPFTYTYIEQVSSNAWVRDTYEWDVADVSTGIQYQLVEESNLYPAISASLSISAPTGKKHYYTFEDDWLDPLNNGSGHWVVSPGLSFARTTDPAIIYGGFSYSYSVKEDIDGYLVEPGWGASIYYGIGFALNDSLSIGSRFVYSYTSTMNVDDVKVQGSDKDAMDVAFSASYRFSESWVLTPQLVFSLNDDAGTSFISFRLNRFFE